jgi:photosystem II stability/assembly factor-like uncharacterized protein
MMKYKHLRLSWLLPFIMILTACAPLQVVVVTATPVAYPVSKGVTVTATPVTRPVKKAVPTNTSQPALYNWLGQPELLFQPGDLPDGVTATGFTNTTPDYLKDKYGVPPDAAASLQLLLAGGQAYGNASLYLYQDPAMLKAAAQRLEQVEEFRRQGVPQPGIGDQAFLFLPEQPGRDIALFFQACRSYVEIRLLNSPEPAVILRYADRLAQRVRQVDCQGEAAVPIQTPPPTLPTSTSQPVETISQGYNPDITYLPDPQGADTIQAYAFIDARHGWVALGAAILATTDGGGSWQARSTAPGRVEALGFQSLQNGWMQVDHGFFATNDGGTTWQAANQAPSSPSQMVPPPTTKTINGEDVYAFCQDKNADLAGPFFAIDAHTGWAFCTSSAMDHFTFHTLYQTKDGGTSWQLLTDQTPYGRYGASNLFFLDGQHGWLAASDMGVFATSDGGQTWQSLDLFPPDAGTASQVRFLSTEVGYVIVGHMDVNQGRDALMGTLDGGRTWQPIYQAPPPALFPTGPFQFFSDLGGVGAGDGGFLVTADAGKSWTSLSIYSGICSGELAAQVIALSFANAQQGWAAFTCASQPLPAVYHTIDGGKTWVWLPGTGVPDDGIAALSFLDPKTGYLVSHSGLLFLTEDGGQSFSPVDGIAVHTRSPHFVTPELGWEIRGTQLFETRDGGHTWQLLPVALLVQYFSGLPSGLAWLVTGETSADNGNPLRRVFTTNDDGETLVEHAFGNLPSNWETPYQDAIQFIDGYHGWLRAGDSFFYTQDGGQDWVQLH